MMSQNSTAHQIICEDATEQAAVERLLRMMRATRKRLGTLEFNWAFEIRRQGREVLGTLTRIPGHIIDPDEAQ